MRDQPLELKKIQVLDGVNLFQPPPQPPGHSTLRHDFSILMKVPAPTSPTYPHFQVQNILRSI